MIAAPNLDKLKHGPRVLVISSHVGKNPEKVGGSFIFDETHRLAERGISIHIIRERIEKDSMAHGMSFHGLRKRVDPWAGIFFLQNIKRYPLSPYVLREPKQLYHENLYACNALRVIRERRIDIVHAHFAYPEGLVGLLASRRANKPLVITVRGIDINTVFEVGYGLRLDRRCDLIIRKVLREADRVLCVSSDLRRKVLALGVSEEKVHIVHRGVDLKKFRPDLKIDEQIEYIRKICSTDTNDLVCINTRHLRPVYGQEYLIKAAKIVSDEFSNVKFIIAGEGPMHTQLQSLIDRLGLADVVKLIGEVPRSFMPALFALSDVYVNTNLAEGLSNSVLEASASGKPVVATSVGGVKDVVTDGVTGFLVAPKDVKSLADRISYLLLNPEIRKVMGSNARKRVEKFFDVNEKIDRIIRIYNELS
jgi:glycosyltransferase involved in cell wall biosynthesis